ncbi:MAG: homoserine O-acetyltransferase [Deltaproteobacteria bacterium]|nr:homoserine O-acetyltransferase [Deltaproteobacteria bacterium]MBW1924471.1 homoserine O-acetyltransferase [Deltaproteobacteria bacterium]MBW1948937.1 homoserine O-acetyltransferase [Deltaproteobacteria bacterium]MBW2007145.1 homoserine O-acetyltransferase [Deltaproteobacteria bacterium]MBW2102271.1 homoserine O-acetyltransferase [Deltaproteobacteria bacterium]
MSEYIEHDRQGVSVGLVEERSFTFAAPPDGMLLEGGGRLGPVTLAYETYGELNTDGTNAVLVCHALSGDAHVAGYHQEDDEKPGWWDIMVGPGKGIDTDRYFVICSNILGSCMGSTGPSSPNPATGKPFGPDFPVVTIGDMVRAQKALVEHLGIRRLLSVIGGSIGGMQVLEWSVRYPEMVASAVPLATTTRHSALAIAFNEVARQAIMADPAWQGGRYYGGPRPDHGLAVARMIGHVTYLSDDSMRHKFGRRLQDREDFSYNFDADFQVESYIRYQGRKFVDRFDANSFLYITKAADYFDLGRSHGGGSITRAFSKAGARFLVVSFTSDWLYPTYQSKEMVRALKRCGLDVSFCEIEARWGHDAFLLPSPRLTELLKGFLSRVRQKIE